MKQQSEVEDINLTPMIDIVFQIIIFFILTLDMDKMKVDEDNEMGFAPSGIAIEEYEAMTVHIQVIRNGSVKLGQTPVSLTQFKGIMANSVGRFGNSIPIVIYGDKRTHHKDIRRVLDACSQVGLWKISFAAVQEKMTD